MSLHIAHLVLDVSVVVAAVSPSQTGYAESLEFIRLAHCKGTVLHEPPQFLLELYAVLNRRPRQIQELGFMTKEQPMPVRWVPIGEPELQALVDWLILNCPGQCPTRGADLAYLSTAMQTKLPLITLDAGLLAFAKCGIPVHTPQDFTARIQ